MQVQIIFFLFITLTEHIILDSCYKAHPLVAFKGNQALLKMIN